jgi:NADH-quinone oxidoreductase subunit E
MLGRIGLLIGGLMAAMASALAGLFAFRERRRRARAARRAARQAARTAAAQRDTSTGAVVIPIEAPGSRPRAERMRARSAGSAASEPGAGEDVATPPGGAVDAPVPVVPGDELRSIRGVGAVSAGRLAGLGVTTLAQLAAWSDEDIEAMAARIRVPPERIRREDWVGQAKALLSAAGA